MSTLNTVFSRTLQRLTTPCALLSIGLLVAGATLAMDASAASFKCTSKSSASEKIVCKDPALSALDDRLAAAWQRAKDTTLDTAALEAARTHQWLWRQHNCTDQACVKRWYDRRIAELDADYEQAKQARREAFDASLAGQNLAPSAADAVRKMKGESVANETTASAQ
ncbi:lysozyme inhibitor LprI family protein [Paraburkholderia sp. RL17-373-BIF-A]|uniref:lysozyme inhibitor LprI family protein n=1 Tax=Paraburkholderia sp. RL17-373-BIF-A TaxID=3031629 RepID=UPI0038BCA38E